MGIDLHSAAIPASGFAFLVGRWTINNRVLTDILPGRTNEAWQEFHSTAEVEPILGGAGFIDRYSMPEFPRARNFHGFALRLYEQETDIWRIWWAASIGGGQLDPPVVGRFTAGEGHFEGEDTCQGHEVKVRTHYTEIAGDSLRWEQEFSFDGGGTFSANWVMEFSRIT